MIETYKLLSGKYDDQASLQLKSKMSSLPSDYKTRDYKTAAATDRRATASDLFSNNDAEDSVVYCDGPTESVRMDTHTTSDHD